MFKKLEKNGFYYGFPVLLMTTKDKETGKSNVTPLSSSFVLGKSIVVGIGFGNKGFKNIEAGSDVTFNVPDENLYENVKKIEKFTGDTEISEVKWELGYSKFCENKGMSNSHRGKSYRCSKKRLVCHSNLRNTGDFC